MRWSGRLDDKEFKLNVLPSTCSTRASCEYLTAQLNAPRRRRKFELSFPSTGFFACLPKVYRSLDHRLCPNPLGMDLYAQRIYHP